MSHCAEMEGNGAENLNEEPILAAGVWAAANAGRRTQNPKEKTADLGNAAVRNNFLVEGRFPSQTISLILSNTIHGCKKLNLRRLG